MPAFAIPGSPKIQELHPCSPRLGSSRPPRAAGPAPAQFISTCAQLRPRAQCGRCCGAALIAGRCLVVVQDFLAFSREESQETRGQIPGGKGTLSHWVCSCSCLRDLGFQRTLLRLPPQETKHTRPRRRQSLLECLEATPRFMSLFFLHFHLFSAMAHMWQSGDNF